MVKYEQGVLSVHTSDLGLAGQTKNVLIRPTLADYPTQSFHTPTETFDVAALAVELPITMEECVVTQIVKPEFDDILYYFGDRKVEIVYTDFVSDEGADCNYHWSYSVEIGESEDLGDDAIKSNLDSKNITIEADEGQD